MKKIIEKILAQHYKPVFEIALFNWDDSVDKTLEYQKDEFDDFVTDLGGYIIADDYYKYIQVSLHGQTEEGCNEITYNLKDIMIKDWSKDYE
jgi:hypothetical protein